MGTSNLRFFPGLIALLSGWQGYLVKGQPPLTATQNRKLKVSCHTSKLAGWAPLLLSVQLPFAMFWTMC